MVLADSSALASSGRCKEDSSLFFFCVFQNAVGFEMLFAGSVPTTPEPNTSAKVSGHKWEAYRDTNRWCIYDFLPRGWHIFQKYREVYCDIFQRYLGRVRGRFDTPEFARL